MICEKCKTTKTGSWCKTCNGGEAAIHDSTNKPLPSAATTDELPTLYQFLTEKMVAWE